MNELLDKEGLEEVTEIIKNYIDKLLPTAPVVDGTYVLKCEVLNGGATYSWELENTTPV